MITRVKKGAGACLGFCLLLVLGGCGSDSKTTADAGKPVKKSKDAGAKSKDAGSTTTIPPSGHDTWPMMGYDNRNNYFNPNERTLTVDNAGTLEEKWRFEVSGYPPGSPIIAEGLVFVMATGGTYALHLNDGSMVWERDDLPGTASPAYADGFVYVHETVGAQLYKLKAQTGETVWGPISTYPEVPSCDGTSSPIVVKDKVMVGHSCGAAEVTGGDDQMNARGGVEAFNVSDGSQAWRYFTVPESGENGATVWSTVTVDPDSGTVFAATGNNYTMAGEDSDSIHAINFDDGTRKWKTQVREGDMWSIPLAFNGGQVSQDTDFGANPILAEVGGMKVVADGDKGSAFWELDRETGDIVWSRTDLSSAHNPQNGGVLMNGAFDGKYFYVASNQPPGASVLHKLDPSNMGADAWPPIMLDGTVWGAPSLANGLLVVPVNTRLRIYNASTGDQLNEFETGGTIAAGAATIANGRIVVKSGLSYVFDSTTQMNNLVICYGLPGDNGSSSSSTSQTDAGSSSQDVSFSQVYKDVIVGTGCNGGSLCHGGTVGMLTMTSEDGAYKALVGMDAMGTNLTPGKADCKDSGLKRVDPGNPDDSLMMLKVEGSPPCGDPMPPTGTMLAQDKIDLIRNWIQGGAKK